jgi:hypothetical protein
VEIRSRTPFVGLGASTIPRPHLASKVSIDIWLILIPDQFFWLESSLGTWADVGLSFLKGYCTRNSPIPRDSPSFYIFYMCLQSTWPQHGAQFVHFGVEQISTTHPPRPHSHTLLGLLLQGGPKWARVSCRIWDYQGWDHLFHSLFWSFLQSKLARIITLNANIKEYHVDSCGGFLKWGLPQIIQVMNDHDLVLKPMVPPRQTADRPPL